MCVDDALGPSCSSSLATERVWLRNTVPVPSRTTVPAASSIAGTREQRSDEVGRATPALRTPDTLSHQSSRVNLAQLRAEQSPAPAGQMFDAVPGPADSRGRSDSRSAV